MEAMKTQSSEKMSGPAIFIFLVLGLFCSSNAFAVGSSGFELATNSARSLGKANSVVADPEEAATVVFNPAGLTKLEGNQISISTSAVIPMMKYEGANGGVGEDASVPIVAIPSTFVALSTPVRGFKVGLGANSPFGLQTQYDSDGNFRYTGYFNEIKTIAYHASAAYEFAPWISVGGGWTYMDCDIKQVAKLNSNLITASVVPGFPFPLENAPFELDADGHGVGWNVGILLTPHPQHQIGVFYRSQVRAEYRGTLDVDNLQGPVMTAIFGGSSFNTSVDTDVTFPDSLTVGYRFSPNEKWDVEVDVAWTNWSVFDRIDVGFGTSNAVLDSLEPLEQNFRDTISVSVGTSYDLNETWAVHGGYWYYEMAANKSTYSNVIPDGDRHGISVGFQYNLGKLSIDISYLAIFSSEVSIDNSVGVTNGATVDGDYSSFTQIVATSLSYRF